MMTSATKRAWKLQEFVAHGSNVSCLALGKKSGRVIVTGGEDKKVNLWAVGKPNCIMSLTGHITAVECVKFNHSEDVVCAGSVSGALKVWDLEAAKILRTLTGHKSSVKCLDFHPYGDFIAFGSLDTNIKLWDIRRKGCIYTYKGHSKPVNNLKFSPDGRWIASAGDDGTVKLWDLPSGKMLTEFRGHTGPVTDVEFHPNEFLLASGSTDRSVRFWDLENFQQVSSSDGDCGPISCIYFSPDGECVFGGSQDVLKVYGWEPFRTFDTLVMGWGRVADISVSQNQLIAGAFSFTNVCVYVVDLKRVQPFGAPPVSPTKSCAPYTTTTSPGNHIRKSFIKGQTAGDQTLSLQVLTGEDSDNLISQSDSGDDPQSCADIKEHSYYNEIFHPAREICRTPPKTKPFPAPPEDLLSNSSSQFGIIKPSEKATPTLFTALPENSFNPIVERCEKISSSSTLVNNTLSSPGLNTSYTKIMDFNSLKCSPLQHSVDTPLTNHVQPLKKPMNIVSKTMWNSEPSSVSIVRPVPIVPEKDVQLRKSVAFPEQTYGTTPGFSDFNTLFPDNQPHRGPGNYVEFVPDQRDHPVGLELEDFLPRHLQNSLRIGSQPQPEMSEAEAMSSIFKGHQSMITVFQHRRKNLQIVLAQWTTKEPQTALDAAINMNDMALIVDMLNIICLRAQLWSLDICQLLLPTIFELLQSKFESYMSVGCNSLKLILKNFATVIKTNITAPPGIGVDITREERYNKCVSCYNHLLSIRSFLLKRQTMQGKLGHSFRELHLLMQSLE
ncbi:katanin p80 WD40 repeat-containing subunit B1-like isoform X2 [Limulus polyphemus]|uniref:Katanin p80 WD40 repeat-containing subunit B1 n=1 Tax=Limulus polyphemus TaxID=6850 RepID=A0ABM1SBP0_LIMPO|nr:katanin p80 WD40 repeat-containing subunit B1-like isoform X2 [Limulus polyphemus]